MAVRVRDDDERLLMYNRRSVNGNYYDYRTISRGERVALSWVLWWTMPGKGIPQKLGMSS